MNRIIYVLSFIVTLIYFNPTTNGQNVPSPACPVYSENDTAKILPDDLDCTRFFICDAGRIKRKFDCPCGLLFNLTLQVCDWPDNVNCTQPPRSCIVPTTPTTNLTTAAAEEIPPTTVAQPVVSSISPTNGTNVTLGIQGVPIQLVEEIPPQ